MKIVIDIPDEEYEDVKKAGGCYYDFGKAIFYGTPLPKGHGRLIDESEVVSINESDGKVWCEAPTIVEADGVESEAKK